MADLNRAKVADILIPKFMGFLYDNLRGSQVLTRAGFVDYSTELKSAGEQVKIALPGDFNLAKQSVDADVNVQDASISEAHLTLDSYVPLDFVIRDVAKALSSADLVKPLADSAAQSYAKFIERDFANVFDDNYYAAPGTISVTDDAVTGVGTNFTALRVGQTIKVDGQVGVIESITSDTAMTLTANLSTAVSAKAFTVSNTVYYGASEKIGDASIRSARTMLMEQNVDEGQRVLVCNPDDYNDLLDDTHYKDKDSINAAILREGSLGRIRSFDTYESNNFNKAYSVGFCPTAVGIAFRVFDAVPDPLAESRIITDPVSKMPIRITLTYDPNKRGTRLSLDLLYGIKLFKPKQVVKILKAAA